MTLGKQVVEVWLSIWFDIAPIVILLVIHGKNFKGIRTA